MPNVQSQCPSNVSIESVSPCTLTACVASLQCTVTVSLEFFCPIGISNASQVFSIFLWKPPYVGLSPQKGKPHDSLKSTPNSSIIPSAANRCPCMAARSDHQTNDSPIQFTTNQITPDKFTLIQYSCLCRYNQIVYSDRSKATPFLLSITLISILLLQLFHISFVSQLSLISDPSASFAFSLIIC